MIRRVRHVRTVPAETPLSVGSTALPEPEPVSLRDREAALLRCVDDVERVMAQTAVDFLGPVAHAMDLRGVLDVLIDAGFLDETGQALKGADAGFWCWIVGLPAAGGRRRLRGAGVGPGRVGEPALRPPTAGFGCSGSEVGP